MESTFSQYEFEFAIDRILEHGDAADIAKRLGMSSAMLEQYFDPNNERASTLYRAAAILAAWIELKPEQGCKALDLFNYFVQRAKPGKDICIETAREKAYREDCEAKLAEAAGADLDTCIREKEEEIAAEMEHLEAMRAARKRQIKSEVFAAANGRRINGNGVKR